MQRRISDHIHDITLSMTQVEAAEKIGVSYSDIRNLATGNLPSLRMLIAMVKRLRCTPESLLVKGELAKLPRGRRTTGAQMKLIRARIRKICQEGEPAKLAKATGLTITSIYQLRSQHEKQGLHTFLAFVVAGHSPSDLLFG
ncbi:MAG: helix-turn-helix transcriptional regulator [Nannocystaceae bacterium]